MITLSAWGWLSTVLTAFAVGALTAAFLYDRAFRRFATFQRTGRPDRVNLKQPELATPGGDLPDARGPKGETTHAASVEHQAAERAYKSVIERGADEIMEQEPRLTREEARAKAKAILEESGAFNWKGGIPSP